MWKKIIIIGLSFLAFVQSCFAQTPLPILKAGYDNLDIRDGDHFRKGIWVVMPEKRPDHYYVELPRKLHKVTFFSDRDSISFDCSYGNTYNFIILRGHDSCYTQVIADFKTINRPKGAENFSDTIPFTIGSNNKIFIQATLNDGPSLKFQFDFGSDGLSIRTATLDKIKLSALNRLMIGKWHWDSLKFDVYDHNMKRNEDGLLGNRLFMDKIVELNYDHQVMIIHDSLPNVTGYQKQPMILLGSIPLFHAKVGTGNPWLIYDSGDSGDANFTEATTEQYGINTSARTIFAIPGRKLVRLNDLEVGGVHFLNLPAVLSTAGSGDEASVLGNSVLKRFNAVIDNRNGYIYFKPNHFLHEPFEHIEFNIYGSIALAIFTIVVLTFLIRLLIKKRRGWHNEDLSTPYSAHN